MNIGGFFQFRRLLLVSNFNSAAASNHLLLVLVSNANSRAFSISILAIQYISYSSIWYMIIILLLPAPARGQSELILIGGARARRVLF